jgi:hypothetical protein
LIISSDVGAAVDLARFGVTGRLPWVGTVIGDKLMAVPPRVRGGVINRAPPIFNEDPKAAVGMLDKCVPTKCTRAILVWLQQIEPAIVFELAGVCGWLLR